MMEQLHFRCTCVNRICQCVSVPLHPVIKLHLSFICCVNPSSLTSISWSIISTFLTQLSIHPSTQPFVALLSCLSVCTCPSDWLPVCSSVCNSLFLLLCPSVWLSLCQQWSKLQAFSWHSHEHLMPETQECISGESRVMLPPLVSSHITAVWHNMAAAAPYGLPAVASAHWIHSLFSHESSLNSAQVHLWQSGNASHHLLHFSLCSYYSFFSSFSLFFPTLFSCPVWSLLLHCSPFFHQR